MRTPAPTPSPARRIWIALLAAGCLNAARVTAQDGPRHVPNLDTMVINASEVMVGRFVETFPSNATGPRRTWTFVVEQKLKGDLRDPAQVLMKVPMATLDAWKTQGHRMLIVNSMREGVQSVDLSAPGLRVLKADLTVLQDAGSIIGAAHEAIRSHSGDDAVETFLRTLPPATVRTLLPGFRASCVPENSYSLCPLTKVPVDEALEQWAVEAIHSNQAWERAEGAKALRHFPSDANITRLKALLDDPGLQSHVDGPFYLVRRSAYEALNGMGVRVPEPAVRPPRPQGQ